MRRRFHISSKRRAFLIRSLIYGTLGILIFAAAASSGQRPENVSLRDIAYIEGRPTTLVGFGLVVGLNKTGDGSRLAHSNKSLLATLGHLGIDPQGATVTTGIVAAVLAQAEYYPGTEPGTLSSVRLTALNDATDLTGGTLLPMTLSSRDGRFRGVTRGLSRITGLTSSSFAPATGVLDRELVCQTPVFMTDVPERDFILEVRGLNSAQVGQLGDHINQTFGQIATTNSGCDVVISLPESYSDFAERASLVLQIAAMPVDEILPALLVDREAAIYPQQ